MPTLLEWVYEAGNEASIKERCGVQRIHFGDTVVDDYLGQGRGLSLFLPLQGVQYSDEYTLLLRLLVFSLLIPADTSECERIFSLMNDTKTSERSKMGQQNLKNLMLWHRLAKKMNIHDVPVMEILKHHVIFLWAKSPNSKMQLSAHAPITSPCSSSRHGCPGSLVRLHSRRAAIH
jgi:hypothetical protein